VPVKRTCFTVCIGNSFQVGFFAVPSPVIKQLHLIFSIASSTDYFVQEKHLKMVQKKRKTP
jgi:hypothetical protein